MRELERDTPRSATQDTAHPPIVVIGAGRVGGSIAAGAERAGIAVSLAGRDTVSVAVEDAKIALLCVPDSEISAVAGSLAELAPDLGFAGHTSGATSLDALRSLESAGIETFSLHPLQTIPDAHTSLTGAPAAIAGTTEEAVAVARRLARVLGMEPFDVPEAARAAYHAAAAISSNFLIALEETAVSVLERAGIHDGRELLAPLVMQTLANWTLHGGAALTGPIARGDEATVERHVTALAEIAPELIPLYEAMAVRTRSVAAENARAT